ncbi:hypothetical protein NQ315_015027, partial [Exocentrus adspersus]
MKTFYISAKCDNENSNLCTMNSVSELDIENLLNYFSQTTYEANKEDNEAKTILERCTKLMEVDYKLLKISNQNGELCPQYPSQLLILESENGINQNVNTGTSSNQPTQRVTDTIYENINLHNIRARMRVGAYSRCRLRFAVPTILYKGKYVCRSSTLSVHGEILGRTIQNMGLPSNSSSDDESEDIENDEPNDWDYMRQVRRQDIKLLRKLNVDTIVDLMVEKYKVKYFLYVSSSEKVETRRYSSFNLISMPYPGCEFFKNFRDNSFEGKHLIFDWSNPQCDAHISIPNNCNVEHLNIEWDDYKQWDLILITQNYIKYLLKYLQENTSGILIHCISGWDRTPLFISLIRLSLWADGLIHQGLNEYQILYLTIAYDWFLFGHNLKDRLSKAEVIFFFCFYILKDLTDDEFSIVPDRLKHKKHTEKATENVANKTEDEPMDDVFLENDHLTGSNANANGTCPNTTNDDDLNGNPPIPATSVDVCDTFPEVPSLCIRCTSPVNIPGQLRRTESTSSTTSLHSNTSNSGVGSWQYVSETGSLKNEVTFSSLNDSSFAQTPNPTIAGKGDQQEAEISK